MKELGPVDGRNLNEKIETSLSPKEVVPTDEVDRETRIVLPDISLKDAPT